MEFRENVDDLMAEVKISGALHKAILEANPANKKQRRIVYMTEKSRQNREERNQGSQDRERSWGSQDRDRNQNRKNKMKPTWRQAAVPAAAALLVMSTMYVGAGYLIRHTPLRDIFTAKDDFAIPVPEAQQRTDIYGEILDSHVSDRESQEKTDTDGSTSGEATANSGKYGEIIIDNELFSIELLETTCAGRELTASYILTKKTDQILTVNVSIDNDYTGQWRDGLAGEEYNTEKTLMDRGFGDSFRWNQLPEGCGYQLEENQELRIITQLGKVPFASGTYTLYADAYLREEIPAAEEAENYLGEEVPAEEENAEESPSFVVLEGDVEEFHYRTPIELTGNDGYGLELNGTIDKTEEQVHFDRYEIYISPMTVYLTLDGTYQGEISAIWGMQRSHDITIGYADGTQTTSKVLLSGMGYGFGKIDVDMHASFGTAIDPESIVSVMLDDIVLMGE